MNIDAQITLRKLSIFIHFMKDGNITRTAEALGISGVSVHRALHTLEEGVRCPLFVHKGRNLVPLQSAFTLLEHSKEAVALMERGIEDTRQAAGVGKKRLRIGTLYSLSLETVPRLIMGMNIRCPDLEMDLTMGSNQILLNMLNDGKLDAILISVSEIELDRNSLSVQPLFLDDIFLAAPNRFPLDTTQPADLRDFQDQKFVSLAEGFATYNGFQEAFHIAGFEPEIVTRVNDIFSMLSLVQAGVGLSLVPGRTKKVYENSIQLLKLAEPYQMKQQIAIVFARNRELDPNVLALAAEGRVQAHSFTDTPNAPL